MKTEELKKHIEQAFAGVEYPGDWCLKGSTEGSEPFLLEKEFKGKSDWRILDPKFLDQAPDGFSSALSFFSDEAFRFYLPAYMLADIDELLNTVDVAFHLTHGLTNTSMHEKVNPRRFGERTWFDEASHRFAMFNEGEARAISAFLKYKMETGERDGRQRDNLKEALCSYWEKRAR